MTYEEFIEKLPSLIIDGKEIEYNKTKVMYNGHIGVIIYRDKSSFRPLLFKSDDIFKDVFITGLDCLDLTNYEMKMLCDTFGENGTYCWVDENCLSLIDDELFTYTSFKLDNDGLIITSHNSKNLIETTPYTPYPINFPTLGEFDLYNNHKGYDFSLDSVDASRYIVEDIKETKKLEKILNEKEEKEMKLLEIYKEKSIENIKKYYKLKREEIRNNNIVQQDVDFVVNEFKEKMKSLLERYTFGNIDKFGAYIDEFDIICNIGRQYVCYGDDNEITKLDEMEYEELRAIDEKIEEVKGHLELVDEKDHYLIIEVLKNYSIVDSNGKVKPYVPLEVAIAKSDVVVLNEQKEKHRGRPKKVNM